MGAPTLDPLDQLESVGVKEVLEHDPRPTLILDLDPDDLNNVSKHDALRPLFCNEALRSHHLLLDVLSGEIDDMNGSEKQQGSLAKFRTWATSVTTFDDSKDVYPLTYFYRNMPWTASTVRKRWRLISGNQCYRLPDAPSHDISPIPTPRSFDDVSQQTKTKTANAIFGDPVRQRQTSLESDIGATIPFASAQESEILPERVKFSSRSSTGTIKTSSSGNWTLTLSAPEKDTPDWTASNPRGQLSDHQLFARSIDWAATPLGDMANWSRELRQAANLVMSNPHPAALFGIAGNKHPSLMGTGAEGPFREIWDQISPIFTECARTGNAVRRENDLFLLERFGYLEEVYMSWSFTPLCGGSSKILGFYNAPFDTTRFCIGHRRMQTLQQLGSTIGMVKTVKEFWKKILLGLKDNHYDVPFALLYSVMGSDDNDELSVSSGSALSLKSCVFEGSIAVPEGHPAATSTLDLKRSREGFVPSFRDAMRTREPTRLQVRDSSLPESLLEGIEWRGFGEPCNEAIIFPLRPTTGESVLAFLLLGINPRRMYDDDYKSFITLMNRQLATALASVLLFEEELRRNQVAIDAANLQQEQLNEQLAIQTERLQRMTSLSPLGMFYMNPSGMILEANDRYFEMTPQDRNDLREMGWMEHLVESSIPTMLDGWHKLTVDLVPWNAELQLKQTRLDPVNPDAEPIAYWVLSSAQPELTTDGKLRSIMGSITDISHLKWAQGLQERRLLEADERRRQQNEFIDITSHEMRNPLSAILQCADDIASTLADYQRQSNSNETPMIGSCIESANTISLCVQHQKAIVDDILTVSKLDSNLLELAPVSAQPLVVAKGVLKMFELELIAKKINFSFCVSPDFQKLDINWVSMDPSRVSQILINLMTNAIKFTGERPNREIKMHIGASFVIPEDPNTANFQYVPRRNAATSVAFDQDWSSGETVYIKLKVEDFSCGLSPDEKRLLFQRFQPASPRTHAQYGGSGLGLFISRQLTELHGGQIGAASEAGVGSTFGFFIRTRKIPPPMTATPIQPVTAKVVQPEPDDEEIRSNPPIVASHSDNQVVKSHLSLRLTRSSTAPPPKPNFPSTLSILVVEDNLVNQKVLMKQLQKASSKVYIADNGQKALDFLETTEFRTDEGGIKLSVVLMDLEMPVMDGLTCVRRIREMEKEGAIKGRIPVIAVTANVRAEQIITAKEAGMDEIVSKPFRIPELLAKVNLLLSNTMKTPSSS